MKRLFPLLALLFPAMLFAQSTYFPPNIGTWDTLSPASLGWCPDSVDALYQYLDAEQSKSFIVLKDGKIVLEKYFNGYGPDSLWPWYSAGKSLRAVLTGIAQEEGFIDINHKVSDYLGQGWTSLTQSQEDSITIWHQLTMTTGLDDAQFSCITPNCLTYVAPAGTRWAYHNGPYNLIKAVLDTATGMTHNAWTTTRLKNPIGMGFSFWWEFGNNTFFWSKARGMARFGLLVANDCIWNGDTLLHDLNYINAMRNSSQQINPSYGYLWWLNGKSSYMAPGSQISFPGYVAPSAPADVYTAAGSQGQLISISPSLGLVMIRQGKSSSSNLTEFGLHDEIWRRIMDLDCTASSASDPLAADAIRIYPNPTTDHIRIDGLAGTKFSAQICDLSGRLLMQWKNAPEADLSGLQPGLYLLRIEGPMGSYCARVLRR